MVLNDGSDEIAPSCSSRVEQCTWTLCNTQQTPVELRSVKWQTSNMLAASFAQSGLAIVTQRCSESSLSKCVSHQIP